MVCKEDVLSWFKESASYRRIDVMCSLLNMCVPFEIRFLGTRIEEQGKHDYQELRGAAIIANDLEKLSKEFSSSKAALEMSTRHRLAIYISLMQSRSYTCANWIYNTMLRSDAVDAYVANGNFKEKNMYQEMLLLFTLALNHPAFSIEQKLYFGDVMTRLTEPEVPPPNPPTCPPGLGYPPMKPPLPMHQVGVGVGVGGAVAKVSGPVTHGEAPLPPPGIPVPAAHHDFMNPPNLWPRTQFCAPTPADIGSFPPTITAHVSQQSSPTPSRSVSPSRIYTCRPHPPQSHPPPPTIPAIVTHIERLAGGKDASVVVPTAPPPPPLDELEGVVSDKHQWMEPIMLSAANIGSKLPNGLLVAGKCQPMYLAAEMQALSLENETHGIHCSSSSGSSNSSECQSPPDTPTDTSNVLPHGPGRGGPGGPVQTQPVPVGVPVGVPVAVPVPVPVPVQPPPQTQTPAEHNTSKMRLNGAPLSAPPDLSAATPQPQPQPLYTSNCSVPYTSQYPAPPPTTFPSRCNMFYTQAYRPQFQYQQNGEIPYLFPAPYLPMMYSSPALPPPKITCYNCGLLGHAGPDCKDIHIEDITQKQGYQLDYVNSPPEPPAPDKQ